MGRLSKPRISIEVSEEMHEKIQTLIPWGLQSAIFRKMTRGLLDLLERNPTQTDMVIALFIAGDLTILDLLKEESKNGPKRLTEKRD